MGTQLAVLEQAGPKTKWHPSSLCAPELAPLQVHVTERGVLFGGDCLDILPLIRDAAIDTVFADPPFNLSKKYGAGVNDDLPETDYVEWCKLWLNHCRRVLKPGGSLFVYNLPKWNVIIGNHLSEQGMLFRHWIAVSVKLSLPLPGRLYPSHYSLLYFTKGKPKTFRRVRTPILTCRHCGGEIRDYGGHRDAMNPKGWSRRPREEDSRAQRRTRRSGRDWIGRSEPPRRLIATGFP
ncbi:MAG: DNA methyltransferase [Acidobacteriota bacterium]